MERDRNLLFAVFAVQLGKATAQEVISAAAAWAADFSKDLPLRLFEMGAIHAKDKALLERLVEEAIAEHQGDTAAALATFGGEERVYHTFQGSICLSPSGGVVSVERGLRELDPTDLSKVPGVHEVPGRYTRESEHARGGMGRILLVHDEYLGRSVALKELLPEPAQKSSDSQRPAPSPLRLSVPYMARFLQEARITGQLEHPAIVPVYELGHRRDGSLYYTMKLVRGQSLDAAIRRANGLRERLGLLPHFTDLCQAIAYAHSRGVIHRDIKPGNVMVGEFGETVVIDWGLAKAIGSADVHADGFAETLRLLSLGEETSAARTAYGQAFGTPVYMPPEQAKGKLEEIDQRSDVYSLGAVLYELLTGQPPFPPGPLAMTLGRVLREEPTPVNAIEPEAPPELIAICRRALRKDPAQRYQSAKSLAEEIERFQSGALVQAYEYTAFEHLRRAIGKNKALTAAVLVASILLLSLGVFSYRRVNAERNEAERQRQLAVSQKDLALEAIQRLTYEVPDKFKDYPRSRPILRNVLEENVALLDKILALEPNEEEAKRQKWANYMKIGNAWSLVEENSEALRNYAAGLELAQSLSGGQRDESLAKSYQSLANIYSARGESDQAVIHYQKALEVYNRLLGEDPKNLQNRRERAKTLLSLGGAHERGDFATKIKLMLNGVEALEELLQVDQDSVSLRSDLSMAYRSVGAAYFNRSAYKDSLEALTKAKAIHQPLIELQPKDHELQFGLALILQTMGNTYFRLSKPEDALSMLDGAVAILTAQFDADPENMTIGAFAATALHNRGAVLAQLGETDGAARDLESGQNIRLEVRRRDPILWINRPEVSEDIGRCVMLLEGLYTKLGLPDRRIKLRETMTQFYRDVVKAIPESEKAKRELLRTLKALAVSYEKEYESAKAAATLREAVALLDQLISANPQDAEHVAERDRTVAKIAEL